LGYHVLNVDSLPLEEVASRLSEGFVVGRNLTLAMLADDLAREQFGGARQSEETRAGKRLPTAGVTLSSSHADRAIRALGAYGRQKRLFNLPKVEA